MKTNHLRHRHHPSNRQITFFSVSAHLIALHCERAHNESHSAVNFIKMTSRLCASSTYHAHVSFLCCCCCFVPFLRIFMPIVVGLVGQMWTTLVAQIKLLLLYTVLQFAGMAAIIFKMIWACRRSRRYMRCTAHRPSFMYYCYLCLAFSQRLTNGNWHVVLRLVRLIVHHQYEHKTIIIIFVFVMNCDLVVDEKTDTLGQAGAWHACKPLSAFAGTPSTSHTDGFEFSSFTSNENRHFDIISNNLMMIIDAVAALAVVVVVITIAIRETCVSVCPGPCYVFIWKLWFIRIKITKTFIFTLHLLADARLLLGDDGKAMASSNIFHNSNVCFSSLIIDRHWCWELLYFTMNETERSFSLRRISIFHAAVVRWNVILIT